MRDLAVAIERRDTVSHEHDLHAPKVTSLFDAIDADDQRMRAILADEPRPGGTLHKTV